MNIEFHPDNIVTGEERAAFLRVEEIKNKVRMGAERIRFYDDVKGIDIDPEEGAISVNDGNNHISLRLEPGSEEIREFSHTRVNKPGVFLKFHNEQNKEGQTLEIYESGGLYGGETVSEKIVINKRTGLIVYQKAKQETVNEK